MLYQQNFEKTHEEKMPAFLLIVSIHSILDPMRNDFFSQSITPQIVPTRFSIVVSMGKPYSSEYRTLELSKGKSWK
ncbi:unnamed protein product, partial [Mycena citricolor]